MSVPLTSTVATAPPPPSGRARFWLFVRAGLSLAILVVAWINLGGRTLRLPTHMNFGLFGAAITLLAGSVVIAVARWYFLSRVRAPISFRRATEITFAAQFAGQVLPSSLGQDAVRVWLAAQPDNAAKTLSVIVLDRLCGVLGICALVFFGLPHLMQLGGVGRSGEIALIAAGLCALAICGGVAFAILGTPRFLPARIKGFWDAGRTELRSVTWQRAALAILLSVGVQAACVVCMWLIALGIGAPLTIGDSFATIPPALFLSLLPFSLNGWGVRESAMIVSLGLAGASAGQAFLVSVLFGLALLIVSLPGAWALTVLGRRS